MKKERKNQNPIIDIFTFINNLKLDNISSGEIRTVRKRILLDIKQTVNMVQNNIIKIEGSDAIKPIVNVENVTIDSRNVTYFKKYKSEKRY